MALQGEYGVTVTRILYPAFLERKLKQNLEMRSAVDATIVDFGSWLKDSKLPFFPDYTDHGVDHLTEVLNTAVTLIRKPCQSLLTAEDAAVLILAVLLHDAALHLSEAGFQDLITGRGSNNRIEDFDAISWPDLWQDFLFSARHWDNRKLIEVFGEAESGSPITSVRDPFRHYYNLSESDRKLIGEFIRQNHPRLAHEFAVHGIPGPTDNRLRPDPRFGPHKLDIAGAIARSHGLPLRTCLEYLNRHYDRREYQNVHAVFLMALLRISDYLQLQPDRASFAAPRYKKISSPLSRIEHELHHAVVNFTWSHEDPESIKVHVEPKNVVIFLRLQELFGNIQEELDASWAVLGEVYGSDSRLAKLGLSIRRIRSNIEEASSLVKDYDYFPGRIELSVAHAEVMKLLVRPLYGDRREIGIRELLQNSTDAVRELQAWLNSRPGSKDLDLLDQEGDVEIWLDKPNSEGTEGTRTLVVSDRGIGMTEKIVSDYFLRVGASYRYSNTWQRDFEVLDEFDHPHSRVLRSGRFGVGVLAAFLLGDVIEVATRHVTADRGLIFRTKLDGYPIEIRYDKQLRVGTTICVYLHSSTYLSADAWDWFCFEKPSVLRREGAKGKILPQKLRLPQDPNQLPLGWYNIETPEFEAVYVGLSEVGGDRRNQGSLLICNGIKIGSQGDTLSSWFELGASDLQLATPATVVLDPDGKLPLDLKRAELTEAPSFVGEIARIASESILAGMLLNTPTKPPLASELNYLLPRFHSSWEEMVSFSPWLETPEGVSLATAWNFLQIHADSVLVIFAEELELHHSSPCVLKGSFIYGEDDQLDVLFAGDIFGQLGLNGVRLLTTAQYGRHIQELVTNEKLLVATNLKLEWTNDTWTLLTWGQCLQTHLDYENLPAPDDRSSYWPAAVEWFFDTYSSESSELSGLSLHWKNVIDHPVIPFDLDDRRKALPNSYKILDRYLEEHTNTPKQATVMNDEEYDEEVDSDM